MLKDLDMLIFKWNFIFDTLIQCLTNKIELEYYIKYFNQQYFTKLWWALSQLRLVNVLKTIEECKWLVGVLNVDTLSFNYV